jgi:hypothetical protein
MFTGQVIDELLASVERAELQALVRSVVAQRPVTETPLPHPYVYALQGQESFEVVA